MRSVKITKLRIDTTTPNRPAVASSAPNRRALTWSAVSARAGGDETWMASIIGWVIEVRSTVKPKMVMLLRSLRKSITQSSIESEMAVRSISSIDPTKRTGTTKNRKMTPTMNTR